MPLHIGEVQADLDMTARPGGSVAIPAGGSSRPMDLDIEKLRPIVLQILEEEMAAFKRQQG
jgi:hypothetical protein